jgi:sugar lactone lactonase YvrE
MRTTLPFLCGLIVAATAVSPIASVAQAQARAQLTISDSAVGAENLTSSSDGTIYFGSMARGTIYRAAPGASQAQPWILASAAGLTNVLGVLADDRRQTLWVCQNATRARAGTPSTGQTALRSFDLKTGAAKGTYPFPANSGICNDMAIAADGAVYVTESFRGRVHRLKPGATALEEWVSNQELEVIDGLAFLSDGALYVNTFTTGRLFRIPVNADGSAGAIVPIETSMPLVRPDGLRAAGPRTLIQSEQQGRVAELTINGNRAEVRVLRDGLTRTSGVTLIDGAAVVLVDFASAIVLPYAPQRLQQSGAGAGANTVVNPEQEILDLSRRKWQWMSERNVDSLSALFHEKAVFVHMGGTMSREQELSVIRSGGIHYKHAEIQATSVRFAGTTAILLNTIRLVAVVGGNEVTNPFEVTEVYVQDSGRWKLASMSFTRLLR